MHEKRNSFSTQENCRASIVLMGMFNLCLDANSSRIVGVANVPLVLRAFSGLHGCKVRYVVKGFVVLDPQANVGVGHPEVAKGNTIDLASCEQLKTLAWGDATVEVELGLLDVFAVVRKDVVLRRSKFTCCCWSEDVIGAVSKVLTIEFEIMHRVVSQQRDVCQTKLIGLRDQIPERLESLLQWHPVKSVSQLLMRV
jgi:hypothetical protein